MGENITTRLRKSASSREAWRDPEKRANRLDGMQRARHAKGTHKSNMDATLGRLDGDGVDFLEDSDGPPGPTDDTGDTSPDI